MRVMHFIRFGLLARRKAEPRDPGASAPSSRPGPRWLGALSCLLVLAGTTGGQIDEERSAGPLRSVEIHVLDQQGRPVPGADVIVEGRHMPAVGVGWYRWEENPLIFSDRGTTDADGLCRLRRETGLITWTDIRAEKDGLRAGTSLHAHEAGEVIPLVLDDPVAVRFVVRRPDGTPVRGLPLALGVPGIDPIWRGHTDELGQARATFDARARALEQQELIHFEGHSSYGTPLVGKRVPPLNGVTRFVVEEPFGPDLRVAWDEVPGRIHHVIVHEIGDSPSQLSRGSLLPAFSAPQRYRMASMSPMWIADLHPGRRYYATVDVPGLALTARLLTAPALDAPPSAHEFLSFSPPHARIDLRLSGPVENDMRSLRLIDMERRPLSGVPLRVWTEYSRYGPSTPGNRDLGLISELVHASRPSFDEVVTPDEDGIIRVPVAPDRTVFVHVEWPDIHAFPDLLPRPGSEWPLARIRYREPIDEPLDVMVLLRDGAKGVVRKPDGTPAADARVWLEDGPDTRPAMFQTLGRREGYAFWSTTTDAQGRFDLRLPFVVTDAFLRADGRGEIDGSRSALVPFEMGATGLELTLRER